MYWYEKVVRIGSKCCQKFQLYQKMLQTKVN